jgi:3-hydroxyisobutyrate dehydrogenase
MAKNLRAKIPEGDTLTVFDVNPATLEQFSQEAVPTGVVLAKNPREVVENAVSDDEHDTVYSFK